jgi:putative transposase
MILTYEYKLYLNATQAATFESWLRTCCTIYNRALEQRIKAYKRRGESVTYNQQQSLLTEQRAKIENLRLVPVAFERDALRRVDRGFAAFFRRLKAKQKPGFPRFRSWRRYTSLEYAAVGTYATDGFIRVPGMGKVKSRGRDVRFGKQKILRILRKPSGWYAQVVIDDWQAIQPKLPVTKAIGIDVGLTHFATLSTGEKVDNPRCGQKSLRKLKFCQRRLARCQRHSKNRRKAVNRVARCHERIAAQRKDFAHQLSTRLVRQFDLIAFENLNILGMVRNRSLARSIYDAAWGMFANFIAYKAESARRYAVGVHAPGTSQECPWCGTIKAKSLSERIHRCSCRPGVEIDRDHASATVILARALAATGVKPAEGMTSTESHCADRQVGPMKQELVLMSQVSNCQIKANFCMHCGSTTPRFCKCQDDETAQFS